MKMKRLNNTMVVLLSLAIGVALAPVCQAQEEKDNADNATETGNGNEQTFYQTYQNVEDKLEDAQMRLSNLRNTIADEKLPLSRELSKQEKKLRKAREEYESLRRKRDTQNLDLNNLRKEIESLEENQDFLRRNLGEYVREFETYLHIAEIERYKSDIDRAQAGLNDRSISDAERFERQLGLFRKSQQRLFELNGGTTFQGQAVAEQGVLKDGRFLLLGPLAYFQAEDGKSAGLIQEKIGSLKPNLITFSAEPPRQSFFSPDNMKKLPVISAFVDQPAEDEEESGREAEASFAAMTHTALSNGEGTLPLDATLGQAHKVEQTKETLWEHIQKGGVVIYPILGLAAFALLVSIIKWIQLALVNVPGERKLGYVLKAMGRRDATEAETNAEKIRGPVGKMIRGAVAHMNEPNELVEEVMYEHILMTRMRLNKGLPFVAVCASSAPLLGLLGTVTGIINTFKLITAFGSGDVKMLSGGISEALVTTEFGLIVAIPSLLFHTFLNRRAKSLIDRMEKVAVSVMNQLNKKPMQNDAQTGTATPAKPDAPTAAPEAPAGEVTESPEAEPVKEEQPVVSAMADNDVNAPADAVGNDTEDPERQPVTVCTSDYNTNGKDNGNGHHKHDGQDRGRPQNN